MGVEVEKLGKLKEPFPANEIKWRVGATTSDKKKGIALAYIDARAVMDKLDEVCGIENWQKKYVPFNKDFVCEIGINIEGVGWVWKADGASETNYEATKGGLSDAFKRAGVSWGIGRYLYNIDGNWVPIEKSGNSFKIKTPPKLPAWALPKNHKENPKEPDTAPKEYKMDELTYITIRQVFKQSTEAQGIARLYLQDCKLPVWEGMNDLSENQAQDLLTKMREAVSKTIEGQQAS